MQKKLYKKLINLILIYLIIMFKKKIHSKKLTVFTKVIVNINMHKLKNLY